MGIEPLRKQPLLVQLIAKRTFMTALHKHVVTVVDDRGGEPYGKSVESKAVT
jgi:hypothetical protein